VKLTSYLHLVLSLKMNGRISVITLYTFVTWTTDHVV